MLDNTETLSIDTRALKTLGISDERRTWEALRALTQTQTNDVSGIEVVVSQVCDGYVILLVKPS